MQSVTNEISFTGYTPQGELVVVRNRPGQPVPSAVPAIYIGTGAEPLEDIYDRTDNRNVSSTEGHGLIGACRQKVRILDGPMELIEQKFELDNTTQYLLDGVQLLPLPATHFVFYEDQQKLCIYRVQREVKFGGTLKLGNNTRLTRVLVTGIRGPINEWIRSAEIFAAPITETMTPRIRVAKVITSNTGYVLETAYGILAITPRKTLLTRAPWLDCSWNGTPVMEFNLGSRPWTIRDETGVVF